MAEYIDRDALFSYLIKSTGFRTNCDGCTDIDCLDCIANEGIKRFPTIVRKIPPSDVDMVRHGRWIKRGYACGENEYECSACHETEWRTSASRMKYCMFCGAKMDLKGESEDG